MKKVLVTGATGFIGRYVVEELLKYDVQVVATSLSQEKARDFAWFSKVQYIPFDFGAFDASGNYYNYFNHPYTIIHLAWQGLPNYKSAFHYSVNLPLHKAFLNNLVLNGVKDVTVAGTCLEYGNKEGALDENMETAPGTPYAQAKDQLRKELQYLQEKVDFTFKWIRLFYMYGKGQNPNSILSQLDRALAAGEEVFNMSGGEQLRDYLPVEKVAEYIVKIALQSSVEGVINCCSGVPITIKDFVTSHLREAGQHIQLNLGYYPYTDYEPMAFWGNTEKLKTIIEHGKPY